MLIVLKPNSGPTLHRDWLERTAWIFETMGTQMPARKKRVERDEKDSLCFLAKVFQVSNIKDMFQRA
jgi:hypothetical protein